MSGAISLAHIRVGRRDRHCRLVSDVNMSVVEMTNYLDCTRDRVQNCLPQSEFKSGSVCPGLFINIFGKQCIVTDEQFIDTIGVSEPIS